MLIAGARKNDERGVVSAEKKHALRLRPAVAARVGKSQIWQSFRVAGVQLGKYAALVFLGRTLQKAGAGFHPRNDSASLCEQVTWELTGDLAPVTYKTAPS